MIDLLSWFLALFLSTALVITLLWNLMPESRFYFKITLYLGCLFLAGALGTIVSLPFGRTPRNHTLIFRIFQLLTFWCGIRFEVRNREYLKSAEPFVIIANHQSSLDVLALTHVWPENCVVLLKSSLRFLPGFNLSAYLCEAVFIDRFSKTNAKKSVDNAYSAIQNKRKVWIFPEGTRNGGNCLLPFKKGAFIIAEKAKVPIVTAVFSPYKTFYSKAEKKFDCNGRVIIEILPPIDVDNFSDIESLSDECRRQMDETYKKLGSELEPKMS